MVQDYPRCAWLGAEVSLMPGWSGDEEPECIRRRGPLQRHPWDSLLLSLWDHNHPPRLLG